MVGVTGFFSNAPAVNLKSERASNYIDVGGEQFHALSVALIDGFKGSIKIADSTLKPVLDKIYTLFPKYVSEQAYLTPNERLRMLVRNTRATELVEVMSCALRQIVIDEMMAHPLAYSEVFDHLNPADSLEQLRLGKISLHRSACQVLATILDLTIVLSVTEAGKELHRREEYRKDESSDAKALISLHVQGAQYFPKVRHQSDFQYVGQLATKPQELFGLSDESVAHVLAQIQAQNKHHLAQINQKMHMFRSMINAGELSKQQLLDFYIEFLPGQTRLAALVSRQPVKMGQGSMRLNSEQYLIEALCLALAEGLVTHQINEAQLFDRMESLDNKAKVS